MLNAKLVNLLTKNLYYMYSPKKRQISMTLGGMESESHGLMMNNQGLALMHINAADQTNPPLGESLKPVYWEFYLKLETKRNFSSV